MADDREVLQDAGKITAEIAKAKAETEFEKYRVIQDRLFGEKQPLTCSLYEEQTRFRRWQFFAKYDFYVGITIILEESDAEWHEEENDPTCMLQPQIMTRILQRRADFPFNSLKNQRTKVYNINIELVGGITH